MIRADLKNEKHQVYEAVVYEIFSNNIGEEEDAVDSEEEVKGASGLLRGLESNSKSVILSLETVWLFYSIKMVKQGS